MVGGVVVTATALSATRSSDSLTGVHTIVQPVVSEIASPTTMLSLCVSRAESTDEDC